jgi:glycerophosphoryl diester phosphodiesterase
MASLPRAPHPALSLTRPLVYAHRGGARLRPENTFAAFHHALGLGADGLELDVHLSRDGVVVVHHDPTLERTTNGRGRLRDHTADELARLDAGFHFRGTDGAFPYRGQGLGVPRLADVLTRFRDLAIIVEFKVDEPELARHTIDAVRAADAVGRVAFGSFGGRVLTAARALEPRIPTGASRIEARWALYRSWVRWPLGHTAYREFQVPERSRATRLVTPRFIAHARRAGIPVKVWTVDEEADMRRLVEWGAVGIITDRPDVAVRVFGSR